MSRKISLFALALVSLSAPLSASVIYVSGDQTGTWSADTVIVTAEVRVPPEQSLTIVPGVEVLFSVYCKLIVDSAATLRAVGTAADSIRFDVLPPNTTWHGIRFLSASDSSRLEYCNLTHGHATGSVEDSKGGAIYCASSGPSFSSNTIAGNVAGQGNPNPPGYGGGICCYNSSPIIIGNIISGNTAGDSEIGGDGGGIYCDNSSPSIIDNTISENGAMSGGGIAAENNSSPNISGNIISENGSNGGGGVLCHNNSNPLISGNTITHNTYGGIWCWPLDNCNPVIIGNTINGNSGTGIICSGNTLISGNSISEHSGGGIWCYDSTNIVGNIISGNSATGMGYARGGGIFCADNSSPMIIDNTIDGNSVNEAFESYGGGIFCGSNSSPTIIGNSISRNIAWGQRPCGGGIYCGSNSSPILIDNVISENLVSDPWPPSIAHGAGIYFHGGNSIVRGNTIIVNSLFGSISQGGGIYCDGGNHIAINSILWGNIPDQAYGLQSITYSDIQGGYTGTGNIDAWPAFVDTAQDDYRLQWGSPCIDSGNPNPIYNDPDGTRSDMGAWYYDQSLPVRILLTPYNQPIQIPASGGSFQYAIQATNIATSTLSVLVWCNATLPSGAGTAPLLGPVTISLASGQTLSRVRTQAVPAGAPAGMYHYNAYAVAAGDTSQDNFVFTKLGSGIRDSGFGGWTNTGEPFDLAEVEGQLAAPMPADARIAASPNPFNPTTAISYELRAASFVSLKIYDTAGRLVTTLVNGWREAGDHQITFDGSGLPSGIYFAKLEAGDYSQAQKLVLLK